MVKRRALGLLTNMVRTIVMTSIAYQGTTFLSCLSRCLVIKNIFIQNAIAGLAISNADKNKEATSGPKINLPPKKNLCNTENNSKKKTKFHTSP